VKGELQEEQYYRIDKIMDDRKVNGKIEVLIKWKGRGADQNTWEPLSNLSDPDMYRKYLDKKKKHKKQKTLTTSVLSVMLTVLLFVPLACAANTQKLINSLTICENPGEEPWNLPILLTENGCMDWKSKNETNTSKFFKKGGKPIEASIVLEEAYVIKGYAYECSKTKITVKAYENISAQIGKKKITCLKTRMRRYGHIPKM